MSEMSEENRTWASIGFISGFFFGVIVGFFICLQTVKSWP